MLFIKVYFFSSFLAIHFFSPIQERKRRIGEGKSWSHPDPYGQTSSCIYSQSASEYWMTIFVASIKKGLNVTFQTGATLHSFVMKISEKVTKTSVPNNELLIRLGKSRAKISLV